MTDAEGPAVLVLAGGRGRRMGADKALLPLRGVPLLGHVLARVAGQGEPVLVSGGDDPGRLGGFGPPVLRDAVPGGLGPLSGVLAGLEWLARCRPGVAWMASVPVDAPFLPLDLVRRLETARVAAGAGAAMAEGADGRAHPVVALWPVAGAGALRRGVLGGERRVGGWLEGLGAVRVRFGGEAFVNLNTPEELRRAEEG